MSVICVARELGAFGDETIAELEKLSGFRVLGREFVEGRMLECGIKPEVRDRYDEKKPGFWASLAQGRDDYIHYLRCVLLDEAAKGDCIVAGRGGFAIFAGVPGVVSVKLVAPIQVRIERASLLYQCEPKRAEQILRQSDHDRKGFHSYFFGVDWTDPVHYDLVCNTGRESPATVARLVEQLRKVLVTPERAREGAKRLAELSLAQAVVTELIYRRSLPVHFLEADVKDGVATLHGVSNTQGVVDAAGQAATAVPGVKSVENAIQVVQEFTVMP